MYHIFVVSPEDKDNVIKAAQDAGEKAFIIGKAVKGDNTVKIKGIDFD